MEYGFGVVVFLVVLVVAGRYYYKAKKAESKPTSTKAGSGKPAPRTRRK